MKAQKPSSSASQSNASDRRQALRYSSAFDVQIRFLQDGTPIKGVAREMGPNGMRLGTQVPLIEASYVQISFESASNNTFCEGRVVWTRKLTESNGYESGIDIQRWGGGIPGADVIQELPNLTPQKDRRKRPR